MGPLEVTGTARLVLGLLTGILFGFLLQRGQALKFEKIVNMLRLKDFTVLKIMLTAILSGMVGVYALAGLGLATLHIKPLVLPANILGGLIFGVGFALLGFCPGTCAASVGEGKLDGLFAGVAGLLLGAGVYSEVYPFIQGNLLRVGAYGKLTVQTVLGVSPWAVIGPVLFVGVLTLVWLDRMDRRAAPGARIRKGVVHAAGR